MFFSVLVFDAYVHTKIVMEETLVKVLNKFVRGGNTISKVKNI